MAVYGMAKKSGVIDLVVEARWVQIEKRLKLGDDPMPKDLADALRNAQPEVPGIVRHYLAELVESYEELRIERKAGQVVKPASDKKAKTEDSGQADDKAQGFDPKVRTVKIVEAHLLMLEKMHEMQGRGDIPTVDTAISEVAQDNKIREEVLKHRIFAKSGGRAS